MDSESRTAATIDNKTSFRQCPIVAGLEGQWSESRDSM